MLDSDASSAKTLTLVAIILQSLFFILGLFLTLVPAAIMGTVTPPGGAPPSFPTAGMGIVETAIAIGLAVGLVWILLDYLLVYRKLAEEREAEAETPAIVLGIITPLFGGIITGILLIIAYVKTRDSMVGHPQAYQYPYPLKAPPPSF